MKKQLSLLTAFGLFLLITLFALLGSTVGHAEAPAARVAVGTALAVSSDAYIRIDATAHPAQRHITEAAANKPCFSEVVGTPFTPVSSSSVAWADYDKDGDSDLVILGENEDTHTTRLYRNDNGVFVDSQIDLIGLSEGAVAWGDYDKDTYPDLIVAGQNGDSSTILRLYRNVEDNAGQRTFTQISTPFDDEFRWAIPAWADYDKDGDPDLVLSGFTNKAETALYRNDNGVFVKQEDDGYTLKGVRNGSLAWGDYDGDNDPDLFLAGSGDESEDRKAVLYRNDNGKFVEQTGAGFPFPGLQGSSVSWADYDKDGDLDLLFAGATGGGVVMTTLYRNDNGSFIDNGTNLAGFAFGSMAWGDYDKDGDLDLMIAGTEDNFTHIAKLYRNDGGTLTEQTDVSTPAFPGIWFGSVAWADYNGDGNLDLLLTGNGMAKLYRNEGCDGGSNEFNVADGDVQGLIDAINAANAAGTPGQARSVAAPAVINLAADGNYTLTEVNNTFLGANGLPLITGTMIINGNGATIARSSAEGTPGFRLLQASGTANLTVRDLTLTNGIADSNEFGGGIRSFGALTLERTRVVSNTAGLGGGGIFLGDGPVIITDSLVLSNSAGSAGGGLQMQGGKVELTAVTIENNRAADGGGLVTVVDTKELHLTINRSVIRNNAAPGSDNPLEGTGGGIRIANAGAVISAEINDTLISNNTAINGGGIGMGLLEPSFMRLQLTLNRSAVVNNVAQGQGAQQGNGGGILNLNAVLHMVNSTVSGNTAVGNPQVQFSGVGGGIANARTGLPTTVIMTNTSVISNTALAGGGILNVLAGGNTGPVMTFANSLIAGNRALGGAAFGPSCLNQGGTLTSLGHNLDQNNNCAFTAAGDQTGVDPLIGPLADNGGSTLTHALLPASRAINAADDAACPATDQRGVARPQSLGCDIGAYEATEVQLRLYLPMTQR